MSRESVAHAIHGLPFTTALEADTDLQRGDCLLNDLTHWHVSARSVFHLTLCVSQEGGFGVHGGKVSSSKCIGGFRFITKKLSAAGWPDLLLDPNLAAFRRLAPAFPGQLVAGAQ